MNHFYLVRNLLWILIAAITSITCVAEKIDNTHYRFCVWDEVNITDYDLLQADANNQIPYLLKAKWYSFDGVKIIGYTDNGGKYIKTDTNMLETYNNISSIRIEMTEPYDGSSYSLKHEWYIGINGEAHLRQTKIYITVQVPSGVSLEGIPTKAITGDEITYTTTLEGTFPTPQCTLVYKYSSSDENVATVSDSKINALHAGKTTITVEAFLYNQKTGDYYYIGEATAEIEVVDNLDPTDISLSSKELSLDVGQEKILAATLTPEDARTDISWSSSDESVATVREGNVKAIGRGNAIIEASTSNGLSSKCYVTVLGDQDYAGVYIDGLYYDLDRTTHEATVVRETDNLYGDSYISGIVNIPEKIELYGEKYIVNRIGKIAFSNCEITSIVLPETISDIGDDAFYSSLLEDIILPDGLTTIGSGAFVDTKLESFIIGPKVSNIGEGAFSNCERLKAVYVDEANQYFVRYNECLYDLALQKLYYTPIDANTIKFSDKIERICEGAICNNHAVMSLEFPETLTSIGEAAIGGCDKLQKLSLPNSLLEIESSAFIFCENLKEINFGSNLKILGEDAFAYTKPKIIRINALNPPTAHEQTFSDYDATLVVPLGRTSTYKRNGVWGKFAKITDDENEADSVVDDVQKEDVSGNHLEIYNMQGIFLRSNEMEDEIKNLPSGLYVVNGKKIVVK